MTIIENGTKATATLRSATFHSLVRSYPNGGGDSGSYVLRDTSSSQVVSTWYRYRDGTVSPVWPPRRDNAAPTNAYVDKSWKRTCLPIPVGSSAVYRYGDPNSSGYRVDAYHWRDIAILKGVPPLESLRDLSLEASMLNAVRVKAFNRLADSKANIGVMWAERRKTADHIYKTASRVYRGYRAFRQMRYRDAARIFGLTPATVHQNWLEYKYAWLPLLMDIHGSVEALADTFENLRPPILRVSSKESASKEYYVPEQNDDDSNPFGGSVSRSDKGTVRISAQAWIQAEMENEGLRAASQVGLTNPALVAWELIPFSFVFDWFFQVGNYLNALSALSGLNVLNAGYSILYECSGTSSFWLTGYYEVTSKQGLGSCGFSSRYYIRNKWIPSVVDIVPPKGTALESIDRLLTLAALGRALSKGSSRTIRV